MTKPVRSLMQRRSSVAALFVTIAILVISLPIVATAAQSEGVNDNAIALYRPVQFDYFFFYDSSVWEIVDQASVRGAEAVQFSDGETTVDYTALAAPGVAAADCVKAAYDQLKGDPSILDIGPLYDDTVDHPQILDYDTAAYVNLAVDRDDGAGASRLAVTMGCQELAPGRSLLLRSEQKPIEQKFAYREPWLVGYRPNPGMYDRDPVPIVADNGALVGTVDPSLDCTGGEFYVVARGEGDDFVIDPAAFTAYDQTGARLPVRFLGWLYPRLPADALMPLRANEVGLFKLGVSVPGGAVFQLRYTAPGSATDVSFGQSTTGCGAAGAAPNVIDIE